MKILFLTLKKEWFDKIASGEKRIEYREYKDYWLTRIWNREHSHVQFRNGYQKDSPAMLFKIDDIEVLAGNHTPLKCDRVFAIRFSEINESDLYDEFMDKVYNETCDPNQ